MTDNVQPDSIEAHGWEWIGKQQHSPDFRTEVRLCHSETRVYKEVDFEGHPSDADILAHILTLIPEWNEAIYPPHG